MNAGNGVHMPKLTFWYEFASTYSYLTAMRIEDVCRKAGVALVWRPFLLGPIFKDQGWDTSPFNIYSAKGDYMWRDLARQAEAYGLPKISRPDPFPQNGLLAARIATMGADTPWGPAFTRSVYDAQFAHGAQISDPALLAGLLDGIGQNGQEIMERAQNDQSIKEQLRNRTREARWLGIFGAPSFITEDGDIFWGDDRLEQAVAWALQNNS